MIVIWLPKQFIHTRYARHRAIVRFVIKQYTNIVIVTAYHPAAEVLHTYILYITIYILVYICSENKQVYRECCHRR